MGTDCSLLIKNKKGIREIELDRFFPFLERGNDYTNKFLPLPHLVRAIKISLEDDLQKGQFGNYTLYWKGYVVACLAEICEPMDLVGIFADNFNGVLERLYEYKLENKLPQDTREYLKVTIGDY